LTKTLQPEDIIAQYRVVGPLGAGGMGEVYLAQDQMLERNVALKVLPPDVVRNEDRVRRFMQEAKSASSLNHPNIVTIYEIGAEKVKSSSGSESGPLQFISMELVSGKTLAAKIHEEKTDLRTLLSYLAQAAEGLAKAHAAGIVHRDLKPGNIMVSDDGFTKVLDFGLAKLTEKRLESSSATAMTEVADLTSEGAVLGTVHYMSPEQVQGKPVDHRSDIFSFGCLLYEAATRRRPFLADSNVETMHKILHDKPTPIEEINPQVPAELRRLIRRCLAKAPDQRLQSMKDLAIELRELVDEYETLSSSATSATTTGGGMRALPAPKRRPVVPILIGALVVAAIAVVFLTTRRDGPPEPVPFQNMRAATQTSRGDVNFTALSADGRYLAYVAGAAGQATMRVRQVATGSDVEILPMSNAGLESPSFSPDGNYLFYLKRSPEQPAYRLLMRIPSLGGSEEQKGFDVDSRASFSPDGKRVCYLRGVPQENKWSLLVLDLDSGKEKELASVKRPEQLAGEPSWSPDGKRIAVFAVTQAPVKSTLVMFDAETGARKDFFSKPDAILVECAWLPDGTGLVTAGTIVNEGLRSQVFVITYPGAEVRRVTNDFDEYSQVSAAAGERGAIAAVRISQISNLYLADPADGTTRRLTSATSPEHSAFGLEVDDEGVVFPAVNDHRMGIARIPFAGGEPKRISAGTGHATQVWARADRIAFQRYDEGEQHIWRVNPDGSGLAQVTNGTGEVMLDFSPDGELISFARGDSAVSVWVVPYAGGEPKQISSKAIFGAGAFTRDGKNVVVGEFDTDEKGLISFVVHIVSIDGHDVAHFPQPPFVIDPNEGPNQDWTFIHRDDPARNIFTFKIDGSTKQLTHFTDGRLADHEWSRDLKRIAVVRRDAVGENLWIVDADGRDPRQLTHFDDLDIVQIEWTRDSQRIAIRAGTQSRDVVLIQTFELAR